MIDTRRPKRRRRDAGVAPAPAALLALAVLAAGCASTGEPDIATLASSSDQIIWEAGKAAFDKNNWPTARQYFKRIVDGFPQSEFGPAARIALGDSYFNEGGTANYILAVSAYRDFLTLYPSHPRADYAQFQVGESYFRQRNSADRDQSATQEALAEFERVLEFYPGSDLVERARERVQECRQTLARAEHMVGSFYQRTRQACRAAILRYETVLAEYPDYDQLDEVLYRLAECLTATGREPEALPYLDRLVRDYPQGSHSQRARQMMDEIKTRVSAPTPGSSPSPDPAASPGDSAS